MSEKQHNNFSRNRQVSSDFYVTKDSSEIDKLKLFSELFSGRKDVYPVRFESRKTGRAGYQPACGNEWMLGICQKPKIKCSECSQQKFLPVGHSNLRWHLTGKDDHGRDFVMGVYPMLLDESCNFLAVDFDGDGWQADGLAYLNACRSLNIPAVMERSRSGQGCHIWIFFSESIAASLARKLGAHALTVCMESYSGLALSSYDRFFPNQDTLPKGGFGNLIALPLQKLARDKGNSVFIDENYQPYSDQWAFLSEVLRMDAYAVEKIVKAAEAKGKVIGVRKVPTEEEETIWLHTINTVRN